MALSYTNFTRFEDVEAWYNATKPIRGPKHKGQDVRPIGDRNRKWERIVKIDDDCYALSDGYHRGDAVFVGYSQRLIPTLQDMENFAPVVWRRYGQGVETVTLRNGIGPYVHSGRYAFLSRHTPAGLRFVQTHKGQQFIKVRGLETPIFLAKATHVGAQEWAEIAAGGDVYSKKWATGTVDTTALTFRRDGTGEWSLISNNGEHPVPTRTVVDTEAKKEFRDAIVEFRNWVFTVMPMLDLTTWSVRRDYSEQLNDYLKEVHPTAIGWGRMHRRVPTDFSRDIITNSEHPARLSFAVCMLAEIDAVFPPRSVEELKNVTARMNNWLNKILGFQKKV